jgi:hypothetical protein
MFSADFIPQRSELGNNSLTAGASVNGKQRQMLRLVDGHRNLDQLSIMLPGRDLVAELADLIALGLITPLADKGSAPAQEKPADSNDPLPDGWRAAMVFMKDQATQSMGVMAHPIVALLEKARDSAAARHAVARWHMAMRESRRGRDSADEYLAVVTRMLNI